MHTSIDDFVMPRPEAVAAVADRLRLLAEPTRLTICVELAQGETNPRCLAELAGVAPAAQAGIRSVRAGLLPEDKAAAGIGAAMGGVGSDLALSSADVVVVRDDLSTLPALIGLSRHARLIVVQNLTFAAVGRPADPATDLASAPSPARAG